MKAVILAAGYATRLYPLTKEFPKPLLKVGSRPMINYIIDKLESLDGLDEIIVVTNSKFYAKFLAWKRSLRCRVKVSIVDDLTRTLEDRRGAVGDMHFAIQKKRIATDLLVVGGDNIFDGALEDFLGFARTVPDAPALGVYDLGSRDKASQYGVIKVDSRNRVVDFQEKPARPRSQLVAMCLYFFPKSQVKLVKEYVADKKHKSDAAGLYIDWLRRKEAVYAFVFSGRWFDIGSKAFYHKADISFKKKDLPKKRKIRRNHGGA